MFQIKTMEKKNSRILMRLSLGGGEMLEFSPASLYLPFSLKEQALMVQWREMHF